MFPLLLPTAVLFTSALSQSFNASASSLAASQVLLNDHYFFPQEDAAPVALFPMSLCGPHGIALEEATIDQLQHYMKTGKLTSVQLLECYLARVSQTNTYINGVLQVNPDALAIAQELDVERKAGNVRSQLHGIPFLVKDNIATKDRMDTTAGSWMLVGSIAPRDAHVVTGLRNAGALLMGHATLSEWADMRSNNYSEGYSARGGQARSPYNLTVTPGGSSSGSAVAVAGNQVTFALGTETDGSVINPAERNGVVGIKPTVGLTSRAGVIPESIHQDTVGTFGRTVRDATYALDAICGVDPRDNYTSGQVGKTPKGGSAQFLTNKAALKGAVFGLPWASFWTLNSVDQNAGLLELLNLIKSAGAKIINGTELPNYETIVSPNGWNWDYGSMRGYPNESEYTVVKVDFYNNIKSYLSELGNTKIKTLEDIVQYNIDSDGTEGGTPGIHPAFGSGQDGFLASLESKGIMNETYYQALAFCQKSTREDGIDAALTNPYYNGGKKLDGLLVPPDVGQTYQIAAQAGYPMITVPAGVGGPSNMPYGLAIMDTAWSEGSLIKWASAIEDLQLNSGTKWKRQLPLWCDYTTRNLPVLFVT